MKLAQSNSIRAELPEWSEGERPFQKKNVTLLRVRMEENHRVMKKLCEGAYCTMNKRKAEELYTE